MSEVAAGAQEASPMPTPSRTTKSCAKVFAMPEAAVSTLQTKTPADRICRRGKRSASHPNGTPTKA